METIFLNCAVTSKILRDGGGVRARPALRARYGLPYMLLTRLLSYVHIYWKLVAGEHSDWAANYRESNPHIAFGSMMSCYVEIPYRLKLF